VIQSNVTLKNRHKSKTDYLILDRKKWDFEIRIILIQIKCFEQLAHGFHMETVPKPRVPCAKYVFHVSFTCGHMYFCTCEIRVVFCKCKNNTQDASVHAWLMMCSYVQHPYLATFWQCTLPFKKKFESVKCFWKYLGLTKGAFIW